jgi:hypothetical protein
MQRRLTMIIATVVFFIASGSFASAMHGRDVARGHFIGGSGGDIFTVRLNAHSDGDGSQPGGHIDVRVQRADGTVEQYRGDVTCLSVSGAIATIVGNVTRFSTTGTPPFPVQAYMLNVTDGPSPTVPTDAFTFAPHPTLQPTCVPIIGSNPVTSGDIVVHDSP